MYTIVYRNDLEGWKSYGKFLRLKDAREIHNAMYYTVGEADCHIISDRTKKKMQTRPQLDRKRNIIGLAGDPSPW